MDLLKEAGNIYISNSWTKDMDIYQSNFPLGSNDKSYNKYKYPIPTVYKQMIYYSFLIYKNNIDKMFTIWDYSEKINATKSIYGSRLDEQVNKASFAGGPGHNSMDKDSKDQWPLDLLENMISFHFLQNAHSLDKKQLISEFEHMSKLFGRNTSYVLNHLFQKNPLYFQLILINIFIVMVFMKIVLYPLKT